MSWRISKSLQILLNEVNAKHPNRDKRTDGTISGYPGSISSHNVNSVGVVNAIDVTVGSYAGGITHAQALEDTELIRLSIKNDPRGYDAYVIYEDRIADGYTGEWRKYLGPRHTSHYHVSSATDILEGGVTLGNADYDIELPWLNKTQEEKLSAQEVYEINKFTQQVVNEAAATIIREIREGNKVTRSMDKESDEQERITIVKELRFNTDRTLEAMKPNS